MIHEKLMSGQFLMDFKNERSNLLNSQQQQHQMTPQHHHMHQQSNDLLLHHQPPSPPMSNIKMDIYAAYAFHHHQQQQNQHLQLLPISKSLNDERDLSSINSNCNSEIVLDLSRRCDSVETPRKTPSPYYKMNSSVGTNSPSSSPVSAQEQQSQKTLGAAIPNNLLYSAQAFQQQRNQPLPLAVGLASLYPSLYYPNNAQFKAEVPLMNFSPSSTPPPSTSMAPINVTTPATSTPGFSPISSAKLSENTASNLLQTFASAATVASLKSSDNESHSSPKSSKKTPPSHSSPEENAKQGSDVAALDSKPTRPFKVFPRDPFVIAANFAAADVLIDNPRVERYTEYRKRILEQIRISNGGTRTVTNPKMRRISSRSNIADAESVGSSYCSSSEERKGTGADESSDCESNAGNFPEKLTTNSTSFYSAKTEGDQDASKNTNNSAPLKDAAYYERRRKNNAAAKKSRDRRRIKEDEIAIRAAYLERQNIELLCQIDSLKAQLSAFTSKVGA